MNICVYGASSTTLDKSFIEKGEELGRKIGERGHKLVFGGGANGMMGAAARGAYEKGGEILGIAPRFFDVDGVLFEHCNDFIFTDTMKERKALLEDNADGFIETPGGVGTFEEFFQVLCLKQLGQHNKPIVVYNINNYFEEMLAMLKATKDKNFMSEKSLKLFFVTSDPDEALDYIENYNEKIPELSELKSVKSIKK